MKLDTTRLVLRELRSSDFAAVHDYASDPYVCRFQDWGPNDVAATQAWLRDVIEAAEADPRVQYTLGITERGTDNHVVGAVSLRVDPHHHSAMLGYILRPSRWGVGYATEAATAMLRFGFDELKLHRIAATCRVENTASIRTIEKLGMHFEGHLRGDCRVHGKFMDSRLYARLVTD